MLSVILPVDSRKVSKVQLQKGVPVRDVISVGATSSGGFEGQYGVRIGREYSLRHFQTALSTEICRTFEVIILPTIFTYSEKNGH